MSDACPVLITITGGEALTIAFIGGLLILLVVHGVEWLKSTGWPALVSLVKYGTTKSAFRSVKRVRSVIE